MTYLKAGLKIMEKSALDLLHDSGFDIANLSCFGSDRASVMTERV